jgi:hypothetical protein
VALGHWMESAQPEHFADIDADAQHVRSWG